MDASPVKQYPDGEVPVRAAQQTKKTLKTILAHVLTPQHDTMTRMHIDSSIEYLLGVPSGNANAGLFSAECPGSSEHRKESENGFVFKEQDRCSWHSS
jgi:hypothetical protein